jgi:repressor LexA
MLTRKQYELLMFINERLKDTGVAPSFDEMKEALGLRSKSGIHRLITALEERGFIRRLQHRARALEVVRLPENSAGGAAPGVGSMQPPEAQSSLPANVIRGDFAAADTPSPGHAEAVELPLYGKIAAGHPIEALRDETMNVEVPGSMLGVGEHFALEVDGDSMVEAGILDGDVAVVRRCDSAESGTIVVALVDGEEVTLKRLRRRGASIALEPANIKYETRIFPPDRVRVQGRLVGLIRRY